MKKGVFSLFLTIFLAFCCLAILSPIQMLNGLEGGFLTNYQDIEIANKNHTFGHFIQTQLVETEKSVGGEKETKGEIVFKLFGFIPIKKVNVNLTNDELYYVGGVPIGLSINTDGALVVGNENQTLKEGDIITQINGNDVSNLDDIPKYLENAGSEVEVKVLRKNREVKTLVKTIKDENSGKLKLGTWVKDDVTGVGTLTFVNTKTHKYGALGHPIVENNGGNVVPVANGDLYECSLIGINKGKKNAPGELRCVFVANSKSKGTIETNNKFGVSGVLNSLDGLVDENVTAKLGGRLGVRLGKAKIISTISGIREEYDIEIIKANYQKSANDKSMVFRVKDKRLQELTGGIVQGMSGSPIIQDGRIIGAVTHVFMNDPCKGYAVYTDWMI